MNIPATRLALIRTRPLGQGNYGGILQAFALQQALSALKVDAVTDLSPGVPAGTRSLDFTRPKALVKGALTRWGIPGLVRQAWINEMIRPFQDEGLMRFVTEHIRTVTLYDAAGRIDSDILDNFDIFVTGSDQVWRAAFGRVPTYLFDFLSADDLRPRIAYAASFGTDADEYSHDLVERTRVLAQQLTTVSVREATGVMLARRLWGIDAVHVLDPTMLLDVKVYSALADDANDPTAPSPLVSYVLDSHPSTRTTLAGISALLGAEPAPLIPASPTTYREYHQNPHDYTRASVEAWLRAIRDGGFVVTDSFHGTVFSILFNTPFISIVNRERGSARFESLLRSVGLEDRLVEPGTSVPHHLTKAPIDWNHVNTKLEAEKLRSSAFLRTALRPSA